jgi:putative cell wall-binding protein
MAASFLMLWLGWAAIVCPLQAQNHASRQQVTKQQKELAKEQKKFAKLQQRVAGEKGIKQAQMLAEMARMSFDFARAAYEGGDAAHGAAQLQSARSFAAQAMQVVQQQAVAGHTRGMKKVELQFQQISYGLHDLAMAVDFAQRPPIEAARQYFGEQRAQVLNLMFAPPKKSKKG